MKYHVYIELYNGDKFIGDVEYEQCSDDKPMSYEEIKKKVLEKIMNDYPGDGIESVIRYIFAEQKEGEEQIGDLNIDDILDTI